MDPEIKLSNRANTILINSLKEYRKADDNTKKQFVRVVEEQLKTHLAGIDKIGMGLDEDKVSAAKVFLKYFSL